MIRLSCFVGLIFLSCILNSEHLYAQVSGVVTDQKTGKPISGVEVFINKTTFGTISDETGQFELANVASGFQEIVLFKEGYSLYHSSMRIQGERKYNLQLRLTANRQKKGKSITEGEELLLRKKLVGIGRTDSISIQNMTDQRLMTVNDQRRWMAPVPLIIQNNATGYKHYYYLNGLPFDAIPQAPVRFELLLSQNVKQSMGWEKTRERYFNGSLRQFLMAMVTNRLNSEGYRIKDVKGQEVNAQSFMSRSTLPDYSKLLIDQPLTVTHKDATGEEQISHIRTNGPVDVNIKGQAINAKALDVTGEMANITFADQLPNDYEPIAGNVEDVYTETIERFYEKVYVHTDKPYYYPGEPLWFKGYIHYREPLWRDSLSRVVYVELISPKNEIAFAKTLKIDSGFFHNDFILSDSLQSGTYHLRAYTNLNRNFGDSLLFAKPIPILNGTDKVVYTQEKAYQWTSPELFVASDKQTYRNRERITLTMQTKSKEGEPLSSNLSIAITDAIQVVPIEERMTITNTYGFEEKQNTILELKYPVEYGVGFNGRFLNDKGKPEKTLLDIFQLKPRRMMMAVTDERGLFTQSGLDFYDTATFSFKSEKAKEYPYGKVELIAREIPGMVFQNNPDNIVVENTQSPQRVISNHEVPRDARILNEVTIKASKIEGERPKRSYGYADIIVKEKDINQVNVLYNLMHMPGVFVDMMNNRVAFTRAATQSMFFGKGPLVTVDDIPIRGESAGAILSALNPANIESIEVTKRLNPLYGSDGANGVIAVYLKKGTTGEITDVTPNFQLLTIRGYSPERKFLHPDYSNAQTDQTLADYRSTIYWNPQTTTNSKTGEASVSFFAADLPGKYRIVVEGVLGNGEPVRSVSFLTIENDN